MSHSQKRIATALRNLAGDMDTIKDPNDEIDYSAVEDALEELENEVQTIIAETPEEDEDEEEDEEEEDEDAA